ncbi:uncharacterized protein BYT42DRAFT_616069 [Radiomyces spectabilis]|uniref:uncharacterized protein n=1 Tax=Radiomyces spectabilis TaxID=64574 RepID=UPI002220B794|nr:uncharacterized protein BYT42DRAFT_616069 [Radiomyces spectabilis]KAI8372868.1 hypothetical protein BYT42DRAFT_616069 [Radiomyces spectabilis]
MNDTQVNNIQGSLHSIDAPEKHSPNARLHSHDDFVYITNNAREASPIKDDKPNVIEESTRMPMLSTDLPCVFFPTDQADAPETPRPAALSLHPSTWRAFQSFTHAFRPSSMPVPASSPFTVMYMGCRPSAIAIQQIRQKLAETLVAHKSAAFNQNPKEFHQHLYNVHITDQAKIQVLQDLGLSFAELDFTWFYLHFSANNHLSDSKVLIQPHDIHHAIDTHLSQRYGSSALSQNLSTSSSFPQPIHLAIYFYHPCTTGLRETLRRDMQVLSRLASYHIPVLPLLNIDETGLSIDNETAQHQLATLLNEFKIPCVPLTDVSPEEYPCFVGSMPDNPATDILRIDQFTAIDGQNLSRILHHAQDMQLEHANHTRRKKYNWIIASVVLLLCMVSATLGWMSTSSGKENEPVTVYFTEHSLGSDTVQRRIYVQLDPMNDDHPYPLTLYLTMEIFTASFGAYPMDFVGNGTYSVDVPSPCHYTMDHDLTASIRTPADVAIELHANRFTLNKTLCLSKNATQPPPVNPSSSSMSSSRPPKSVTVYGANVFHQYVEPWTKKLVRLFHSVSQALFGLWSH